MFPNWVSRVISVGLHIASPTTENPSHRIYSTDTVAVFPKDVNISPIPREVAVTGSECESLFSLF